MGGNNNAPSHHQTLTVSHSGNSGGGGAKKTQIRIGGGPTSKRLNSRAKSDQELKLNDPSNIPARIMRKTVANNQQLSGGGATTGTIGGRSNS